MRDRARRQGIGKVVMCASVMACAVAGGALVFAIRDRLLVSDPQPTGTVQITRQGSTCQRLVIDNAHGGIQSSRQIPCSEAPRVAPATVDTATTPSRYSTGGRVEAIRDSFRSR
jgi:hypothetical protein